MHFGKEGASDRRRLAAAHTIIFARRWLHLAAIIEMLRDACVVVHRLLFRTKLKCHRRDVGGGTRPFLFSPRSVHFPVAGQHPPG